MKWLRWACSGLRRNFSSSTDGPGSKYKKLFVVQPRCHPSALLKAKLLESLRLAHSLAPLTTTDLRSELPCYLLVQGKRRINAGTYFGSGTIDNIRTHLDIIDTEDAEVDAVFVNASLSGVQQRNLEEAWERPVLDRVGLIIEIFGSRARSKEAKLQVELAALDFKRTRLVRSKDGKQGFGADGEQEVVSARGRASGGGGRGFTSGSGESELNLQRRRIADQKHKLQVLLAKAKQTRSLHRSNREGIPLVAVVGYTNAGKSTLVGALSKSSLYSDDRLFATLDTQLRSVILPSGRRLLMSDTVGFISDLPTQLVEAFHATLEEVLAADIVLHVMDSSAPNMHEQREAVLKVLKEIGVSQEALDKKTIEVMNKIDVHPDDGELDLPPGLFLSDNDEDALLIPSSQEYRKSLVAKTSIEASSDKAGVEVVMPEEAEVDDDEPPEVEILGTQLLNDGKVARVSTSATQGTGLDNLLRVIDARLRN